MRWFEVESRFDEDARIRKVLKKFGNRGLGGLMRLWGKIADKGARPGVGVDRHGEPLDLENLADSCGMTARSLRELLDYCARIGHVDADRWRSREIIAFPAMMRRAAKLGDQHDHAEVVKAARERRFARIAERLGGRRCVHCGSDEQLELERIDATGGTEDANLQICCVPCGRRRRAASRTNVHEGGSIVQTPARQNEVSGAKTAERNQDVTRMRVQVQGTGDLRTSTDRTHTQDLVALARESSPAARPETPTPGTLPLLGVAHPPRRNANGESRHVEAHAWCGRKCVPWFLHSELLESIGGPATTREERLIGFYRAVMAAIPADKPIPDSPLIFWRRAFAERMGAAEGVRSTLQGVTGGRPQEIHRSRTVSTGADLEKRRIGRAVARARR